MRFSEIELLKEQANRVFASKDYITAKAMYEKAILMCEFYAKEWNGKMPYKMEFGEDVKLETGGVYLQDFERMKAILYNNISTCCFQMGKVEEAD